MDARHPGPRHRAGVQPDHAEGPEAQPNPNAPPGARGGRGPARLGPNPGGAHRVSREREEQSDWRRGARRLLDFRARQPATGRRTDDRRTGGAAASIPGVAGQEIIDVSHWIGALITVAEIIGTTASRRCAPSSTRRASLVPAEQLALCVVGESGSARPALHLVRRHDLVLGQRRRGLRRNARHLSRRAGRPRLSIIPEMYEDIWTGAKGFYKLEPAVADGGEVILYAPHITADLDDAPGDQRDRLPLPRLLREAVGPVQHVHWGTLAHSTHLRGAGTYDAETGEERLRVQVTLATGIPEEVCRDANLGYLDPPPSTWPPSRPTPGTFVVPERRRGPLPAALSGRATDDEPHRHDDRLPARHARRRPWRRGS